MEYVCPMCFPPQSYFDCLGTPWGFFDIFQDSYLDMFVSPVVFRIEVLWDALIFSVPADVSKMALETVLYPP